MFQLKKTIEYDAIRWRYPFLPRAYNLVSLFLYTVFHRMLPIEVGLIVTNHKNNIGLRRISAGFALILT